MAKCKRCGRGSLFKKLEPSGLCRECEALHALEQQRNIIENNIAELSVKLENREAEYAHIFESAKRDALMAADKEIKQIEWYIEEKKRNAMLLSAEFEAKTLELEKSDKAIRSNEKKLLQQKEVIHRLKYSLDYCQKSGEFNSDDLSTDEIDVALAPTVEIPLQYMNVRELRNQFKRNQKEIIALSEIYQSRYTLKTHAALYRLMVIGLESELQNVLYGISYGKLENSIALIKKITGKYLSVAVDGNQNIAPTMKRFIGEIEFLFIRAVEIEYEYYVQKERIKEEQRALREQMRQEAEERKQLEAQKKQLEKEEEKYVVQINNIFEQIETEADPARKNALTLRIDELAKMVSEIEGKKEEIVRLQHGQAGHVYVISNLGSFGDGVFKIGMTRRLDPLERINELGSASVPFPFDVHSFVFSDNAVDLERKLHQRFNDYRVNKVNLRKEFFQISIDELESTVYELQPTAEFNRTLLAQQYYQSQSIDKIPDSVDLSDEEDEAILT